MLIQKYTSTWVKNFTAIKCAIEKILQGFDFTIEHIGSTAVPNLDAKPIIDIDIIYYNQSDFDIVKSLLENGGYYHNGNQGIIDRDVFKRNQQLTSETLDTVKHHLYVCSVYSEALERHILSRDFLRKNDWARLAYQEMKYQLAKMASQDRKKYAGLKEINVNEFIDSILRVEKQLRDDNQYLRT
jgi:GrpB-like predicted nucleotidyltransferase (UPF0157 family)